MVDWVHPEYSLMDQWKCVAPTLTPESESSLHSATPDSASLKVAGEFKIEAPTGTGISGMSLAIWSDGGVDRLDGGSSVVTDENGQATLSFPPNQPFIVKGVKSPDYQDMYIFGTTGEADFKYTTFMGTRAEAQTLAALSTDIPTYDATTAYLVIGMDTLKDPSDGLEPANLIPAVGARARVESLPTPYGGFIFDPTVTYSTTITNTSSSFVTYPNVQTGVQGWAVAYKPSASAGASAPAGSSMTPQTDEDQDYHNTCTISPGFTRQVPPQVIEAFPDSVTVVSFLC